MPPRHHIFRHDMTQQHPPTHTFMICVLEVVDREVLRPKEKKKEAVWIIVLSCLVLSCLALSCLVLSCLVLSWLVLACLVLSCLVLSWLGLAWLVLSWLVWSVTIYDCEIHSCLMKAAAVEASDDSSKIKRWTKEKRCVCDDVLPSLPFRFEEGWVGGCRRWHETRRDEMR